ncbi:MAG: sigma-70 family RNA polymerase sigma factor [Kineosporiaceae bacterium]
MQDGPGAVGGPPSVDDPALLTDGDLARRWAAGDPAAFGEAYRRFAPSLFGTAVGLLGDRSAAGDVVHDTFVRAAPRVGALRDPDRLRPWLFAILRNEATAVHRARQHAGGSLDDGSAAAVTDLLADGAAPADVEASRAELAALVWTAADGLQDRDREVLELNLRGGLDTADLADALGVTPGHAAVLLSRMRDRLERCLGALLVARLGRRDCDALDRLLDGWDGRFSLDVRSRVSRHVEGCARCGERRTAMVSMERLAPAILPPVVLLPSDLRARLVASLGQDGAAAATGPGDGAGGAGAGADPDPRTTDNGWDWRDDGFPVQEADPIRRLAGPDTAPPTAVEATPVGRADVAGAHRRRRRPLGTAAAILVVALPIGVAGVAGLLGTLGSGSDAVEVALDASPSVSGAAGTTAATDPAGTPSAGGTPSRSLTDPVPSGPTSVATAVPSAPSATTGGASGTPSGPTTTPVTVTASRPPTRTRTTTRTTTPTLPAPPVILRAAVSPSTVQVQVVGAACSPTTAKVTVAVQAPGTVRGTASWSPDGRSTKTVTLTGTGSTLDGVVGPWTVPMGTTVDVTVRDADGQKDTRSAKVTVQQCAVG